MSAVMQGLIKRGFTPEHFLDYLRVEVAPKMSAWRPRGAVLHNTGKMEWPGHTPKGVQITPEQRIDNMSVDWVSRGFSGGPHLVIAPDGMIWAVWPLWKHGTHSPSYNATFWGVEMVGDFDKEPFLVTQHSSAITALAGLYSMLGREPTFDSFHFHKEDPATSHKHCPGIHVGLKADWLKDIAATMRAIHPGEHAPATHPLPPVAPTIPKVASRKINDATLALVKHWEAFRATQYSDKGFPAIGYGRRDGFRGFKITPGMVITEDIAAAWLRDDLEHVWSAISPAIKSKLTDNQAGACTSMAYNVGAVAFISSTLVKELNVGDLPGAAKQFGYWVKAKNPTTGIKETLQGLVKRRAAEAALFLTP